MTAVSERAADEILTNSLAVTLSRRIAEEMDRSQRILSRDLDRITKTIVREVPCIRGGVLVALDEKYVPIAAGVFKLSLPGGPPLKTLARLWDEVRHHVKTNEWVSLAHSAPDPDHPALRGLPLSLNRSNKGFLILDVDASNPDLPIALEALTLASPSVAFAVTSSIEAEAGYRIHELHELTRTEFDAPQIELERIIDRVSHLFVADAVTLLLADTFPLAPPRNDELRLSVTTDKRLQGRSDVTYRRGEGLTGYIFETGESIRLVDSKDQDEVRSQIGGITRKGPTHPEHAPDGRQTARFLGVAVKTGERILGVVRMSRTQDKPLFTLGDERALHFFGDLLGISLVRAWNARLIRDIKESRSISYAVSRSEQEPTGSPYQKIVMANAGTSELLGFSQRELIGEDVSNIYYPADYILIKEGLRQTLRNRSMREYGPISSRVLCKDGRIRTVTISFRLLADDMVKPPWRYTIGIARDNTEGERHRRLTEMMDEMGVAYFQADREGRTVGTSPAESRITGYSKDELRDLQREKLFMKPSARKKLHRLARRYRGQLISSRQRFKRKDGTEFWAAGVIRILKDYRDQEIGVEGLYKDVTDRLNLQTFIDVATDQILPDDELFAELKRNAEFQLDYLNSVGHQLLTPLVYLVENLKNFQKYLPEDSRAAKRMPYIVGQARVSARMVRNLSFMDKILRGESFRRQKIHLAKLVIETKIDFAHLLRERRLRLEIDDQSIDRHLEHIEAHPELMRQVIVNLVDNAIKYSSRGTRISIRGHYLKEGPVLEISNRGLPIPEDLRKKIFQRGYRSNKAKMTVPYGTGLGLWLVRRIVEAHDATIRCLEITEQGEKRNLFRIVFPRPTSKPRRHA